MSHLTNLRITWSGPYKNRVPRPETTSRTRNLRIPMVKGGGSRPSVAPRTPARAPRATRAYIWRAFPPETSGPATRPRRGLAPRAAQVTVTGRGYFFASVTRSPHPTAPACSYDPCASKAISARLPCAVRERQGARPVARRRAARPTGTPITRTRCLGLAAEQ